MLLFLSVFNFLATLTTSNCLSFLHSFYDAPFCTPGDSGLTNAEGLPLEVENVAENLGEVLAGDRMESTGYQLHMQEHSPGCQILCRKLFTGKETKLLTEFIDKEYRVNMWVDNLPAAQKLFSSRDAMEADVKRMDAMKVGQPVPALTSEEKDSFMYSRGYLIGQKYTEPAKEETDGDAMFSNQNQASKSGPDVNGLIPGQYFINNHLQFLIRYHTSDATGGAGGAGDAGAGSNKNAFRGGVGAGAGGAFEQVGAAGEGSQFEGARIVGFEVVPVSVHHEWNGKWKGHQTYLKTCNMQSLPSDRDPLQLLEPIEESEATGGAKGAKGVKGSISENDDEDEKSATNEVVFTYTTVWYLDSATKWSERWDIYFDDANRDNEIHWFSIFNSLLIVLFLSAMVAMILTRSLYRDIAAYNDDTSKDELAEETGWKLVHGDGTSDCVGRAWVGGVVGWWLGGLLICFFFLLCGFLCFLCFVFFLFFLAMTSCSPSQSFVPRPRCPCC